MISSSLSRLHAKVRQQSRLLRSPSPFSESDDEKGPKVLANSINKSGTHLLGKLLSLLELHDLNVHLLNSAYWDYNHRGCQFDNWDAIERDKPFLSPLWCELDFIDTSRMIRPSQFALAHIEYSNLARNAVIRSNLSHVFMFRDPRDIVLSFYKHVTYLPNKNPPRRIADFFRNSLSSDEERISAVITGVDGILPGIRKTMKANVGWLRDENTLPICFEDLVGPKGGGTEDGQRRSISKIYKFLHGSEIDETTSSSLIQELWGGSTKTFNKGHFGLWRSEFTEKHVDIFKGVANDCLLEYGYESDLDWRR